MRPSALNLASKCHASYRLATSIGAGDKVIQKTNQWARFGNAFHELAKAKVLHGTVDVNDVKTKYGMSDEEVDDLVRMLRKVDINLPAEAKVYCEESLRSLRFKLNGTPDVFAILEETKHAILIDWKSGFVDSAAPESNFQMIAYAFMIMEIFDVESVECHLVQPRRSEIKSFTFTRAFLEVQAEEMGKIIEASEKEDAALTTGSWCMDCFASMKCPAFAGEVVRVCEIMFPEVMGFEKDEQIEAGLKRALPFVKAFARVATRVENLAKAYVDMFGSLELGGGMIYQKTLERRQEIDPEIALPILRTKFPGEAESVVKIPKSAIEALAKKSGKRGEFGTVLREIEAAGGLKDKPQTRYGFAKQGEKENGIREAIDNGSN